MRIAKFTISIIILIIFSYSSSAQTVRILNEITEFPIDSVAIYNQDSSKVVFSNSGGKFSIDVFADTDTLIFYHELFEKAKFTKDQLREQNYDVYLSPAGELLEALNAIVSNVEESSKDLPFALDVIAMDDLKNLTSSNSPDAVATFGKLTQQKSQFGGGSPVLRGFEPKKILLVLDGVRLNNAIYRNGHFQNSIAIDNSILDRAEVMYGPTSQMYGNDALGGVIIYSSKKPKLGTKNTNNYTTNAYLQYSTINDGKIGHVDFNFGTKKFASLSSFTYKDFSDIKIGKNRSSSIESDYGLTKYYVGQINGKDAMLTNSNPDIQLNTGFKQYDIVQKFLYEPSRMLEINLNTQFSTCSNIGQYSMLTEISGNHLRYAESYMKPELRLFTALHTIYKADVGLFTNLSGLISYQKIKEVRVTRRFEKDARLIQNEDIDVFGLNLDFAKLIGINRIAYGIETSYHTEKSNAENENIYTLIRTQGLTRYPTNGSKMVSIASYINYKWTIDPQYLLTLALRYSYINIVSKFSNQAPQLPLPFDKIDANHHAPTVSMSLVSFPFQNWQFNAIIATGFHSPNVDDYGKVSLKDSWAYIPNNIIKPEYAYDVEIGIIRTFSDQKIRLSLTGFYTWINDAIVRRNYSLNSLPTRQFGDDMYNIVTNQNTSSATIKGLAAGFEFDIPIDELTSQNIKFRSTFNFLEGKDNGFDCPLANISPFFGQTSISYRYRQIEFASSIIFNAEKPTDELTVYGEDNIEQAPKNGYPSWYSINARISARISKKFTLQFAVDNLLDKFYRSFSSGISAPGRNFILIIKGNF